MNEQGIGTHYLNYRMNPENNLEKPHPEQKKVPTRNLADLSTLKLEEETHKEEILLEIRNQLSVCRGTGEDRSFTDSKTGEVFHDCGGGTLEEYNQTYNEKLKIDERLVNFIYNEFLQNGYEVIITSGFRCPDHNNYSAVFDGTGTTKKISKHSLGQAADLILKKQGKYLKIDEYGDLIKSLEKKYQFADRDYEKIKKSDLSLDENRRTLFYARSYDIGEGKDPDNYFKDNDVSYMHFDFRGIDPNDEFARKYYLEADLI